MTRFDTMAISLRAASSETPGFKRPTTVLLYIMPNA